MLPNPVRVGRQLDPNLDDVVGRTGNRIPIIVWDNLRWALSIPLTDLTLQTRENQKMKTFDKLLTCIRWRGVALVAPIVMLSSSPAMAQEDDKFEIAVGGYSVFRYESAISLTETNLGAGISISPRDTLGLDSEQTVFRLDGLYRFDSNHAMTFSWFRINANASKTLVDDIEWVDENGDTVIIPIGTSVSSSLGYDIYKLGYLWSFYHSDKVELAAGAGLHLAEVKVGLGVDSAIIGSELRTAKSNLPMPVLSFLLDYKVTPKFDWYLRTQLFAIELGEWRGVYSDIDLGMKYQLFEHIGIGAGIGSNGFDVVQEEDNTRFEFENRIAGLHFFVSANF